MNALRNFEAGSSEFAERHKKERIALRNGEKGFSTKFEAFRDGILLSETKWFWKKKVAYFGKNGSLLRNWNFGMKTAEFVWKYWETRSSGRGPRPLLLFARRVIGTYDNLANMINANISKTFKIQQKIEVLTFLWEFSDFI
jgi:hypothetical protein